MAEKKEEVKEEKKTSFGACGFENKQYFGDSGKGMFCTLAKDHAPEPVTRTINGQVVISMEIIHRAPYPEEGADPEVLTSFSDAAGTPLGKDVLVKLEAAKEKKDEAKKAAEKK